MPDQPATCSCPNPPRHAATCPATADLWPGVAPSGPAGASLGSTGTCDASTLGDFGPLGPCILRHQHDGPIHKDTSGTTWWPTVKADKQAPDPLAPFRALADRYAAKAAESTRHAKIADDDEKRLATQGIAAGWRSAEFLLRHTLTDLDNHRTTPDNLAADGDAAEPPGFTWAESLAAHLKQGMVVVPITSPDGNDADLWIDRTQAQTLHAMLADCLDDTDLAEAEPVLLMPAPVVACSQCGDVNVAYQQHVAKLFCASCVTGERRSDDTRRRALARNAVGAVLNTHGQWLPLSVREAVADAVLDQRIDDALNGPTEPTS